MGRMIFMTGLLRVLRDDEFGVAVRLRHATEESLCAGQRGMARETPVNREEVRREGFLPASPRAV